MERLPIEMKILLSLSPKFSLETTNKEKPYCKILSDVESVACAIENEDQRNVFREIRVNIINNDMRDDREYRINCNQKFLNKAYKITKDFLHENARDPDKEIYIMNSDNDKKTTIFCKC